MKGELLVGPRRLRRRLVALWSLTWMLGIGILLAVALREGLQRRSDEVDRQLALRAMAVYGLSWFEDDGRFEHGLVDSEPLLSDPAYALSVFDLEGQTLLSLHAAELDTTTLLAVAQPVARGRVEARFVVQGGLRVHAAPLYSDRDDALTGVVVIATDAAAGDRHEFVILLVSTAVGLGLAGLGLGVLVVRRVVAPLSRAIEERQHFLASAAHELRTPITTLRAITESARAGDEPAERAFERMESELGRAQQSVANLLTLARLSPDATPNALELEPVRLDLLADKVAAEFPEVEIEGEPATVEADSSLLEVAIRNLLHNAARHGRAPVRLHVDEQALELSDAGRGFSATQLQRGVVAFTPEGRGRGLGPRPVARCAHRCAA